MSSRVRESTKYIRPIDALFLDFAKAFGKVSHDKLCHKLSHNEINGQVLSWIKDYLSDRS